MRVLGVDISSVSTGWCILDDGKIFASGVINPVERLKEKYGTKAKTKASIDQFDVMRVIAGDLSVVISRSDVDLMVVEDVFLKNNYRTVQLLARLSGAVLWDWLARKEAKPILIYASSARSRLGCKGNVKKPEVRAFINYKYKIDIDQDDIADAFVLAMYGYESTLEAPTAKARRGKR
jgi:Holliday junction resolvasome RuvABC endonuclease subunit